MLGAGGLDAMSSYEMTGRISKKNVAKVKRS